VRVLPPEPALVDVQLPHKGDPRPCPLLPTELERLLSLGNGTTAAKGVDDPTRMATLGRGIGPPPVHQLLCMAEALQRAFVTPHHMATLRPKEVPTLPQGGGDEQGDSANAAEPARTTLLVTTATPTLDERLERGAFAVHVAGVTEAQDAAVYPTDTTLRDVWRDEPTMSYLQKLVGPPDWSPTERARVLRRARDYRWHDGQLLRNMADGSTRIVPPPAERAELVKATHERLGHFGVRRTTALLATAHWWYGMRGDVRTVVSECKVCDQANSTAVPHPSTMQPLPIKGLGYRWHVDLAGPLPATPRGNRYVLIAVEAYSKHVEMVPLPNKSSNSTARAFRDIAARFSAPAEVVTDQGDEWELEFAALLEQLLVDHRHTSANHPQANGSAERVVQTLKRALRKCIAAGDVGPQDWDDALPWIALGYRCSPQEATGYSPYQLLYGVTPVVPPAARARLSQPLAFEDPDLLAKSLSERARTMQREAPLAGGNLLVAQQRDTHRYARVRATGYKPRFHLLQPGDYCYVGRRNESSTLQLPTLDPVLRVVRVDKSGIATLIGRCGTERKEHVSNLRPCHLTNLDPIVDPRISRPSLRFACEVCGDPSRENKMVLCPNCGTGWHTFCLDPPLPRVPSGTWVCPRCTADGVTVEQVEALPAPVPREEPKPSQFPNAAQRRRHEEYAKLEGRHAERTPASGRKERGVVHYRGWLPGEEPFAVRWEDGSEELMSVREVNRVLVPETRPTDAAEPTARGRRRVASLVVGSGDDSVIESVAVQEVWEEITGVPLPSSEAILLARQLTKLCSSRARLCPGVAVPDRIMECLEQHLALPPVIFDPWADEGGALAWLRRRGHYVGSSSFAQKERWALVGPSWDPATYAQEELQRVRAVDAVVSAPKEPLLDWALPIAAAHIPLVVMLVPTLWFMQPHPARQAWLTRLDQEGRLLAVHAGWIGTAARRLTWIVVSQSRTLLRIAARMPSPR